MSYQNELSNLSYTNKDFSKIYPELLELVQKISYKWDPMYSDESDPGVVLLKLAALMADKCNYNIDKNTLEQFPLSVTQLANARQLFDQCGYTMRYYTSTETNLKLRMIKEPSITLDDFNVMGINTSSKDKQLQELLNDSAYKRSYIIPRFTMFCDNDSSSVFTITKSVEISSNGDSVHVTAVEGTVASLSVNGSTNISINMLDSDNRVYFPVLNIPENGIFINNVNSEDLWKSSDNLLIHPLKSKIYKFGLTLDGKRCYVEFPSDIDSLIGEGLEIHYVTTSGYLGNVKSRFIKKFFNETKCSRYVNSSKQAQEVDLTVDNVYISNLESTVSGKDPETIDDAYRNYQKVKNTFSTLVTTKDYTDYLRSEKQLSNCIVCDRSDDLQSSYKVLNNIKGVDQLIPFVRKKSTLAEVTVGDEVVTGTTLTDEMSAFDLRVYGLTYVDSFDDYDKFRKSFMVENNALSYKLDSTSEVKCISHDFIPFEQNRIILLKNRYPIVAKIISSSVLGDAQKDEIIKNVNYQLYQLLNSQKVEFGQNIDYTAVYNTILNADSRITGVALEDFQYETYAVYLNSKNELDSVRIDANSVEPERAVDCLRDENDSCGVCKSCLWKKFRTEIYARSVMQGTTSLFTPAENSFAASLANEAVLDDVMYEANYLTSESNIELTYNAGNETRYYVSDVLHENDVINITSPNLVMDQKYSSYVQYITNIGLGTKNRCDFTDANTTAVTVYKNSDYVLQADEYIIFFWKASENTSEYTYVKYTGRNTDNPTIISPSFDMNLQPNPQILGGDEIHINDSEMLKFGDVGDGLKNYCDGQVLTIPATQAFTGYFEPQAVYSKSDISFNSIIERFIIGSYFNLKTSYIETKKVNTIHLNNEDDGTSQFYWILNKKLKIGNDRFVYRLFSADPSDDVYTLQEGEQLIYSDPQHNQFYILGAGTRIKRTTPDNSVVSAWDCAALDSTLNFLVEGPDYFEDDDHRWFDLKSSAPGCNLYATEMQFYKLGKGTRLKVTLPEVDSSTSFEPQQKLLLTKDGIRHINGDSLGGDYQLHLCSFSIIMEDGVLQDLPDRKNKTISWNLSSALNLNMSIEAPQRVYSNQTLILQQESEKNTSTDILLHGSDSEKIYVQADVPVVQAGGVNVDIRTFDVTEDKFVPAKLYIYKFKDNDLSFDGELDGSWTFSDNGVTYKGTDCLISNIKLEPGNYVIPVQMRNVKNPVNVYWRELRKLVLHGGNDSNYALTSKERRLLSESFKIDSVIGEGNLPLWEQSRKPTNLSDFVAWVYSYMNIDTTAILSNQTVKSVMQDLESKYSSIQVPTDSLRIGDVIGRYIDDTNSGIECFDTFVVITDEKNNEKCVGVYRTSDGIACKILKCSDVLKSTNDSIFVLRLDKNATILTDEEPDIVSTQLRTIQNVVPSVSGTYHYIVEIKDSVSYAFELVTSHLDADSAVPEFDIMSLKKFTYPTLTDLHTQKIDFFDDVIDVINSLDVTGKFNYLYQVPSSTLIKYPLKAASFVNDKHVFNKFTICEYVESTKKVNKDMVVIDRAR